MSDVYRLYITFVMMLFFGGGQQQVLLIGATNTDQQEHSIHQAMKDFRDLLLRDGNMAMALQVEQEVDPQDAFCYNGTFLLMDYNLPGGLVAAFTALETLNCFLADDDECDYAGSDFEKSARENCNAVNGRLVTSALYLCRDEFGGSQFLGANENIRLANVPLCVDPTYCPSDITFQKILKTAYALGSGGDTSFEGTFTGKCAPIEIDWKLESAPFQKLSAKVGDVIIFKFDDDTVNNVYIHPSGGCDNSNAISVNGDNGGGGSASYTFQESDGGKTIVFASNVESQCEQGQMILSVVVQGETPGPKVIEIDWKVPSNGEYANQTARVGDTVKFTYSSSHNVYKHPSGTCDEKHSLLVGDLGDGPGFYRFIPNDMGKTVTFACNVGSHCEVGQIIHFQVQNEDAGQPPSVPVVVPTMQPSPAPTLLSSEDFAAGIANGEYDVILDVRTRTEWNTGHIEGATLAESLAAFGNMGHTGAIPSDLAGCEFCTIAVYCRSGARASSAIQVLIDSGFQGKLYNGQGTSQWTNAGFPLVTGESVVPPCTLSIQDSCVAAAPPSGAPPNDKNRLPDRKRPKPGSKDAFKIQRTRSGSPDAFTQIGIRGGGGRRKLTNDIPQEMEESI